MKGKNVFITGTNRGLGKAFLEEFAKRGANVIAHARQETSEFKGMCSDISTKYGVSIDPVFFDMTDTNTMKSVIKDLFLKKIPVDVLINSAGILYSGMFMQTPVSKFKEIFDINFFAQLELTQLILRIMMRQKSGSIINIASIGGLITYEGQIAYAASKAALISWTKNLSAECGRYGIRVNALALSLMDTGKKEEMSSKEIEYFEQHTVLGRIGTAQDAANAAVFLASDEASFINGQIIRIDGGLL